MKTTGNKAIGPYKISGTGWLCRMVDGRWIPLTKLTDQQLEDVKFEPDWIF